MVFKLGDQGDKFYLIAKGVVSIIIKKRYEFKYQRRSISNILIIYMNIMKENRMIFF